MKERVCKYCGEVNHSFELDFKCRNCGKIAEIDDYKSAYEEIKEAHKESSREAFAYLRETMQSNEEYHIENIILWIIVIAMLIILYVLITIVLR